MLKTKGTITYITKENPDHPITRKVLSAYQQTGLYQINLKDSHNAPSEFLYSIEANKWLVPDKEDEYGDMLYKEFEGDIVSFEYGTYWEED